MRVPATVLGLAAVIGCTRSERPAAPVVSNVAVRGPARELPDGWVRFDPDPDRLYCARWGKPSWQMSLDPGGVKIAEREHPPDDGPALTGPPLPFTVPKFHEPVGSRHTLAVADGFLVGFDAGEWGGSLHWYSRDGRQHRQLADGNVHGFVAFGPDEVVALEGLNHITLREGNARWIERRGGSWRVTTLVALDAGPETFASDRDAIYVVTTASLTRIGRDRRAAVIQPLAVEGLYPGSMVIDDAGRLWIGMRQLALRLTRTGKRFTVDWLAQRGCLRAEHPDMSMECTCAGD